MTQVSNVAHGPIIELFEDWEIITTKHVVSISWYLSNLYLVLRPIPTLTTNYISLLPKRRLYNYCQARIQKFLPGGGGVRPCQKKFTLHFFSLSTTRSAKIKSQILKFLFSLGGWGWGSKVRPILGAQGFWAERDLYATPAVSRSRLSRSHPKVYSIQSPLTTHKGMISCWGWDRGPASKQVWHDKDYLDPPPCSKVLIECRASA
jgi:hypothetical protein